MLKKKNIKLRKLSIFITSEASPRTGWLQLVTDNSTVKPSWKIVDHKDIYVDSINTINLINRMYILPIIFLWPTIETRRQSSNKAKNEKIAIQQFSIGTSRISKNSIGENKICYYEHLEKAAMASLKVVIMIESVATKV